MIATNSQTEKYNLGNFGKFFIKRDPVSARLDFCKTFFNAAIGSFLS